MIHTKLNHSPLVSTGIWFRDLPWTLKCTEPLTEKGTGRCTQSALCIWGFSTAARKQFVIHGWWIHSVNCIFIEKGPHISEPMQFKPVVFKGQRYFLRGHQPCPDSARAGGCPGDVTLPQEASGKARAKKPFSPAAGCVFPSVSLTFGEALPAHLGMPEREEWPRRTGVLGSSPRTHSSGRGVPALPRPGLRGSGA